MITTLVPSHVADASLAGQTAPAAFTSAVNLLGEMNSPADTNAAIMSLSDKRANQIVAELKKQITSGAWYPADSTAFEQLLAAYKSKDKLDVRRELLAQWYRDERTEYDNVMRRADDMIVARMASAKEDVDVRIANGEAGDERTEKKPRASRSKKKTPESIPVIDTPGFPPTVEGGGIVELQLSDGTVLSMPDAPVQTVDVAPANAKPARAKKPAAPVEEKQPVDEYANMDLPQLLAEVQRVFGHGTTMTNESSLRYKLRRAKKQIAAGQPPKFSVSTPSKPTVRLSVDRAKQVVALLKLLEERGVGIAGVIMSEIEDQLKTSSDDEAKAA